MKKFIIENEFWELFPDARIGVVICKGIDNKIKTPDRFQSLIYEGIEESKKFIKNTEFSKNPVISVWREAFKKFKTKKGVRSSIESLLKRVASDKSIGTINPLVDIYNSVSLKYGLPCGGEDIDTFIGDVKLTKAKGNERFITLGSNEITSPYKGEIVYKDEEGTICRCWNWRESVRTMLTEKTKNAFLCIESIDDERVDEFTESLNYLKDTIKDNLGGEIYVEILDRKNNKIEII